MKLYEITKEQIQAAEEAKQQRLDNHAIESIVTDYQNGHIHFALALKQLCNHNLTIQQAEQRLNDNGGNSPPNVLP